VFQTFYVEIKNQFGASIDVLRSDNAKEFFSLLFVMRKNNIVHQSSCFYTQTK